MPPLPLSQAYASVDLYGEPARHVNVYVESAATATEIALRPRPCLHLRYTIGAGPVRAQMFTEGAVGAGVYAISGNQAFKDGTLLGNMSGDTGATIASSGDQVVFTLGGLAYIWDGVSFAQITDSDLPSVSGVIFLKGRFFYQQEGADTWYFSAIFDAGNIDGLAFGTAESNPDSTRGVAVLNEEAWFFGTESVDPHYATGDADAPLQAAQGRVFTRGCASQASIVTVDNTLFWLSNTGQVCRASNVPKVVSTPAIDAKIKAVSDITVCTAFTTIFSGHEFYVINLPGQGSFAYDATTDLWSEWQTYGEDTFRVLSAVQRDTEAYLGDAISGNVYGWSDDVNTDNGAIVTRIFSAYLPTNQRNIPNFNISLNGNAGQGARGADGRIEMRFSDNGRTWSQWREASLGALGEYDASATWWRLGRIGPNGRRYEFRLTDPLSFSASGMTFNEHRP